MKQGPKRMDFSTLFIWGLALTLVLIATLRGKETVGLGLTGTWDALLRFLPLLVGIFVIIGFSDVLLPKELIAEWLGGESGLKGIFIASGLGAITPGGPFVSYPLVATLYEAGAGIGPVVAFVTAWSLWAVSRLPLELAIVGPRITAIRLASTLLFPPLAGFIAATLLKDFAR